MTTGVLGAAFLLGASVLLWGPSGSMSLGRLGLRVTEPGRRGPAAGPTVGLSVLVLVASGQAGPRVWLVLGGAAAVAVTVRRLVRSWRLRRARRATQRAVIELCDALAAELRAGLPAVRAIEGACGAPSRWAALIAAARLGGDVATALRGLARSPGGEGLFAIAAAWDVAGQSGAALSTVLDRVAEALRSDEEARAEVIAALGPPRATAKMLAVLPVFGLGLGVSMGAQPVTFLLGSEVGLGCLTAGVVLALAGVLWVERLADTAEV